MPPKKNKRPIRQLPSDDDSESSEIPVLPSTSTPTARWAHQPPAFDLQTIHKGEKRVIRRKSSSPSEPVSNPPSEDPTEVDQLSSSTPSPPPQRASRHQDKQRPSTSSRQKGKSVHPSTDSQQDNQRPSTSSRQKGKAVHHSPPKQMRTKSPSRSQKPDNAPPQPNPPVAKTPRKKKKYLTVNEEIRKLQRGTELLIPRLSFSRVVREVLQNIDERGQDVRWTRSAIEALHEAAEMFLVQIFEVSSLLSLHARRLTLMKKDMQLARRVWGDF